MNSFDEWMLEQEQEYRKFLDNAKPSEREGFEEWLIRRLFALELKLGRIAYEVALRDPDNAGMPRCFEDVPPQTQRTWGRAALVDGSPLLRFLRVSA